MAASVPGKNGTEIKETSKNESMPIAKSEPNDTNSMNVSTQVSNPLEAKNDTVNATDKDASLKNVVNKIREGGLGGLGSFLIMLADGVVKIVNMAGARNRMNVPHLDSSVLGMDMPLPDIDSDHQKKSGQLKKRSPLNLLRRMKRYA